VTGEPLDAPFWTAASKGRLVVQQCAGCATAHWPAVARCGRCGDETLEWVEVAPEGRVWSYAVYHRNFDPRLEVELPYVVVAVELEAGVCLPGRLVGDRDGLAVGATLEARFIEVEEGLIAPAWSLTTSSEP
jgi:uncharacterized OB-fold protein